MKNVSGLVLALGLTIPMCALAQDPSATTESLEADDLEAMHDLLEVLAEETDVATKTRMNADYVPGIVKVMEGDVLRAFGVRNVWEAMRFVPGVEATLDPVGTPNLIVREVPFPFNSGSIQLLIDGANIARESTGINGATLLMPIDLVERIELIRGPGAVIYGDFAFQGLINIITRKTGNTVSLSHDPNQALAAHALWSKAVDDWRVSLNVATQQRDRPAIPINARTNEEDRLFASAKFGFRDWSLAYHAVRRKLDLFRNNLRLDAFDENSHAIGLSYDPPAQQQWDWALSLDHLRNDLTLERNAFVGKQTLLKAETVYTGFAKQSWLFGFNFNDGVIDEASSVPQAPPGTTPRPPLRLASQSRRVLSVYAQDQIQWNDQWSVILGARFDDNSEVGTRITPRVAAVWRMHPTHLLKFQMAEGYRSPTFFELYTDNPNGIDLDFEVNRTTELSYLFQHPGTAVRLTAFKTDVDDMVFRNFRAQRFENVGQARAKGLEFELQRELGPDWRLDVHLTKLRSEHNRNPTLQVQNITAAADWYGQLALLWNPLQHTTFGLHYDHVGPRPSAPASSKDYGLLNLSYLQRNLFGSPLDLRLSAHNLNNDRVSYILASPTTNVANTYQDRETWAQLIWNW